MMKSLKKGFTLIELLVVITIIGILATGAVTTFTSQIQKARDTTRISDIQAIQSAVEQVYQDYSEYPDDSAIATFATDVEDYLPNLPSDSKNTENCQNDQACGYVYAVWDSNWDGTGIDLAVYEISAWFENAANVDTKAVQDADNGDDDDRFEVSNNPSVAPTTEWDAGDTAPSEWINID